MVDLRNTRAAKLAAADRLQNRPLPPARQSGESTERSVQAVTPVSAAEPKAPEETLANTPKPVVEKKPASRQSVSKKRLGAATKPDRKVRIMLSFTDEALHRLALEVADLYSVPVEDVMKAIAKDVEIQAEDYIDAPEFDETYGDYLRYPVSVHSEAAENYATKFDPLKLRPESIVLRPVALYAFDRAARKKLAALKKAK